MVIAAFWGVTGSISQWEGFTVLPSSGMDAYGCDLLGGHVTSARPDLVIILADAWPLNAAVIKGLPCPVALWMPVDADRLGAADERMLRESGAIPVAMSRHGEKSLKEAGFSPLYAPHGIDTSLFCPPADRDALRAQWGIADRFVIGANAANKDAIRKGYPEQMMAFARFRKKHPEALLLIHALPRMPGNQLDLEVLARRLGLGGAVMFSDQYRYVTGAISPSDLASWYGVLDLYTGCSYGEGFGIPLIEAQACGVPVVTTGASAMRELAGPGWKVAGEPFWNPVHEAWWTKPHVKAIERAYEKAHQQAAGKRQAAREFALGYDADSVLLDSWKPALDDIMARSGRAETAA